MPALVDVPCVSAQLDDSLLCVMQERVVRHGSVSSHPPVQIEELVERAGGVLVRWSKVKNTQHIMCEYSVLVSPVRLECTQFVKMCVCLGG